MAGTKFVMKSQRFAKRRNERRRGTQPWHPGFPKSSTEESMIGVKSAILLAIRRKRTDHAGRTVPRRSGPQSLLTRPMSASACGTRVICGRLLRRALMNQLLIWREIWSVYVGEGGVSDSLGSLSGRSGPLVLVFPPLSGTGARCDPGTIAEECR